MVFLNSQSRRRHSQLFLKKAASLSRRDTLDALRQLANNPRPQELMLLLKILTTSGVWLSHSSLRYMASHLTKNATPSNTLPNHSILDIIANKRPLPQGTTHEQAFQALFHDIEFSHRHQEMEQVVSPPKVQTTLVLISGVFNEIFSTPAFARGAEYLSNTCGLKRVSLAVSGTKGIQHNTELIHAQLCTYLNQHPNEKLWIVAFSKGGVDALHFMHQYKDFSDQHIQGISLMASPIMGTRHLKHKALSFLQGLDSKLKSNKLAKNFDFLARELREALSEDYQGEWFHAHYHELPKRPFYTALAFEAQWYQSHLWMILTKLLLQSKLPNDGVVDSENAQFPSYFQGMNLGVLNGHHLVGTRSSFFSQEALLEAHLTYLNYLGHLD